jgi:Tfp pilus assembly protein PilN
MNKKGMANLGLVGLMLLVFACGYLLGATSPQPAQAQLKDLAGEVLKQQTSQGGAVGTALELGQTIVDMQEHVDALQKNIATLKKVQKALGM